MKDLKEDERKLKLVTHLILAVFATLLTGALTQWGIHEMALNLPLYWIEIVDYFTERL